MQSLKRNCKPWVLMRTWLFHHGNLALPSWPLSHKSWWHGLCCNTLGVFGGHARALTDHLRWTCRAAGILSSQDRTSRVDT
eukprot:3299276-Amphidinium_carterae.2